MKQKLSILLISILLLSTFLVGCGGGNDTDNKGTTGQGDKVTIEFFQNKKEAVGTYNKLIQKFQDANPNITVKQNNPPDAETVLKTRMTKNDIPDVMGLGGNFTYGEVAKAGVLKDFTNDAAMKNIQPAYTEMLNTLAGTKESFGIPYTANAQTVIYNKKMFDEMGLTIPTTWSEFITVSEKIKSAGKIPFYLTFKDAWTTMIPWNSLAANLHGDDFFEKRNAGQVTFKDRYRTVSDRMLELLKYGHKDNFGKGYDDGNTAFAKGQSVMYIQGIWAIPSIIKANPDIQLGVFAFPATDKAEDNKLVSGVDTLLTVSKNTKHPEEAQKFVEFLLQKENAQLFIDEQKAYSAVQGVTQNDPTLVGIKEYIEKGRLVDFPDHFYPSGMQFANLVQEFLLKKDVNKFLDRLDNEWNKVQGRK